MSRTEIVETLENLLMREDALRKASTEPGIAKLYERNCDAIMGAIGQVQAVENYLTRELS